MSLADPQLPPSGDALLTLPGDSGALQISIWTWPQPAIKGSIDLVYRIADLNGLSVDGLGLQVVPWMPAHGHGTSPTVVTSEGDGYYLIKPVYLYMSGRWEMRTTIKGSAVDSAVPVVDIP